MKRVQSFSVRGHHRVPRVVLPFLAALLLVGCGDDENPSNSGPNSLSRSISVCNTSMTRPQLVEMLDGNLAIVAGFSADGWAASEIVGGFIAGLVINTLDFEALNRWNATFSNGRYRIRNGGNTMDLYLVLGEPFGDYLPGDTLKENLFAPSTYVRNVSVNLSGVSYAKGPLHDLIAGGITWNGGTPRFRLDVTKLTLGVVSNGNWLVRWSPLEVDTIRSRMASFPLNLGALKSDFEKGLIGFSYDSTRHANAARQLQQGIDQSGFSMRPLDDKGQGWSWEGEYRNVVNKILRKSGAPLRVYIRGNVSTVNGNSSAYYCDEAHEDLVGIAVEDTSLAWGYFKSVRGDSITYGLIPAVK
jgi:hypothetical protein